MSALTGPMIEFLVKHKELVIEPFDPARVNPNSYNLEIERTVYMYEKGARVHDQYESWYCEALRTGAPYVTAPGFVPLPLRIDEEEPVVERELPDDADWEYLRAPRPVPTYGSFERSKVARFWPGVLYLLCTKEYTESPYPWRPHIDGRSSLGRLGEFVHVTAGYGDVGFKGTWTLEVAVVQPVETYWPLESAQISYTRVEGPRKDYDSPKYQGQRKPQPSRLWKEIQRGRQQRQAQAGRPATGPAATT